MRTGKFYFFISFVVLLVIAIEGDLVLEIVSHLFEFLVEALEMIMDTVFEAALGLTPRGAQVLTAWLAVGLLAGLGTMVTGKLVRGWKARAQHLNESWHESVDQANAWYARNRLRIILIGSGIGLLALLILF